MRKLAAAGKLHGLQIAIGDSSFGEGRAAISNDIFDEAIGSRLMISGLERFEDQKVDAKTISGRLHLESPHETSKGLKLDYEVKFSAPIQP